MKNWIIRGVVACFIVGNLGCETGGDGDEITEEELATLPIDTSYEGNELIDPHVTDVRTAWSPANALPTIDAVESREVDPVDPTFSFCAEAPAGEFDINHAAWLAFFSANVYSHFGHFGPQLADLGFTNPAGGEFEWGQCALDLKLMQADEAANTDLFEAAIRFGKLREYLEDNFYSSQRWGACAKEWFEQQDDIGEFIFDGTHLPESDFRAWLLAEPRLENYVQFGCGGEWDYDGEVFEEGSTQAALFRRPADPLTGSPPIVIVAFRGTEKNWSDISVDLAFFKTELDSEEAQAQGWGPGWGSVHRGFFNAYRSLDEQARAFGNAFIDGGESPEIYLTGHSLGGALATVLASRILQDMEYQEAAGLPTLNFKGVYTFGSPRVGNDDFVEHFNELAAKHNVTVARVRNGDDTVTNTPGKTFGFTHVGELFLMSEAAAGSQELDSDITHIDVLDDEPDQGLGVAGDHSMAGYTSNYQGDPELVAYNSTTHVINETGYYRRLHEAYLASKDPNSTLAVFNHCD